MSTKHDSYKCNNYLSFMEFWPCQNCMLYSVNKVECSICKQLFNIEDVNIEEYEGVKYAWCGAC